MRAIDVMMLFEDQASCTDDSACVCEECEYYDRCSFDGFDAFLEDVT